ncbi:MAG: hypothetical protein KF850_25720 [Labilithrix sp.]|nr:hypothetical protein [Labilithrix sp.]
MRRLLAELAGRHSRGRVDAALASLYVHDDGAATVVTREPDAARPEADAPRARATGSPLFGPAQAGAHPPEERAVVRLAPRVYAETPTSEARARVLQRAAALAPRVEVHAPAVADGTYRGRLAIDLPRRAARALGLGAAEPGDRFTGRFVHAFFDDEALVEEAARAGLAFVARRGAWVDLERRREDGDAARERAEPFRRELARALGVAREAERLRRGKSPEEAVRATRERGRDAQARGPVGRARLRRAIGWVDAASLGGPNCFRRTLMEMALDAGAARETLVFGLDLGRTGHVAFKDSEERAFDVAFEVPPDTR